MKKSLARAGAGVVWAGLLCSVLTVPVQAGLLRHHPHFGRHPHGLLKHHPRFRHHPHGVVKHHPRGVL